MKAIVLAVLTTLSASLYAQAPTPAQQAQARQQAKSTQAPPPGQPAPPAQPAPNRQSAPPPAATPVEPKHSEATANLRAIEAEKSVLLTQQQNLINQVNSLIGQIRDKDDKRERSH